MESAKGGVLKAINIWLLQPEPSLVLGMGNTT